MNEKEKTGAAPGNNKPADGTNVPMKYSTGGVFNEVDQLAKAIKSLGEKHNLIIPGGAVGAQMPPLHAAAITFVFPNVDKESYAIPGKDERGPGKTVLDRIASAAGVRWNPHFCGRIDDGKDPYFVEFQAAGTVRELDGSERMICGSKRVDLRADEKTPTSTWGADARNLAEDQLKKKEPKSPWPAILQARQHILSLAETKAKNRAIRSLGIKAAYSPKDLEKGFAIVRLQFTGRSEDPEVQREIELMIAGKALDSGSMLYGNGGRTGLAPGPSVRVMKIASAEVVDDDEEKEEKKPESKTAATASAPAAEAAKAPAEPAPERAKPANDPMLICGDAVNGNWPRKPCSEFTVDQLRIKIEIQEKKRPNWDPKWAAKNETELLAMKAWLAYKEFDPRQGVLPGCQQKSDEVVF